MKSNFWRLNLLVFLLFFSCSIAQGAEKIGLSSAFDFSSPRINTANGSNKTDITSGVGTVSDAIMDALGTNSICTLKEWKENRSGKGQPDLFFELKCAYGHLILFAIPDKKGDISAINSTLLPPVNEVVKCKCR